MRSPAKPPVVPLPSPRLNLAVLPPTLAAATPRSVSRTDSARGTPGLALALLVRTDLPMSRHDLAAQVGLWEGGGVDAAEALLSARRMHGDSA